MELEYSIYAKIHSVKRACIVKGFVFCVRVRCFFIPGLFLGESTEQQYYRPILLFLFFVIFFYILVLAVRVFGGHDEPGEDADDTDSGNDLEACHSTRSQKVPCAVSMMLTP